MTKIALEHGAGARAIDVEFAGERVSLLPQRAAFWHARRTLLVSDLHLGKIETFGAQGIPLPEELMLRQLRELGEVIDTTRAERVLVLGDLLHAPAGLTERMMECVRTWRETRAVAIDVVPGNHDRNIEKAAAWWGMRTLQARHDEGPFTFVHEPVLIEGRAVFAGHVHPVARLRTSTGGVRLWCFVIDRAERRERDQSTDQEKRQSLCPAGAVSREATLCTLPAFCDFTSGGSIAPAPGRRIIAIADGSLIEL